jgi:hypothetical protein
MRRALFALLLVGCTNPDDILPVQGRVVDPSDGQVVRLLRHFQEYGTSQCRSDLATPFKETAPDSEGNFRFDLFRIEAQSFGGVGAYCFRAETTFASGSVSWADFNYLPIGTQLAPLRDWHASPRLEGDVLKFEPPVPLPPDTLPAPGELVTTLDHKAQFVTDGGLLVWSTGDRRFDPNGIPAREPMVFDSVRLEDFSGTLILEASLMEPSDQESYGFTRFYGGPVAIRAAERLQLTGVRRPVSRGVDCPEVGYPCALTDGDLSFADAGQVEDITLELTTASPLSTVVMRGAESPSRFVDLSLLDEDGGVAAQSRVPFISQLQFDPGFVPEFVRLPDGGFGNVLRSSLVIPVDAGVPVKKVKLHFDNGLWRAQEISLFD